MLLFNHASFDRARFFVRLFLLASRRSRWFGLLCVLLPLVSDANTSPVRLQNSQLRFAFDSTQVTIYPSTQAEPFGHLWFEQLKLDQTIVPKQSSQLTAEPNKVN
ncbi:hypothetical protein [Shewanella sp.]|uniref:hypothetical protein n=1 Tax=Shewanella sp. TaxID=50422 RepID=UPI0040541524